ncbi:sterol desaturase/sphingolipid hydroxylase (fatty acid hydroxylase superfamily) [Bradyrhizobium macuxiense]|uniref:Sterol desaturase/sphingolipid hydroxylase (Fatty acid hydroxylase superfamily) n=1 Tax=Bradyrhizobium macuxiense TaxID=1755647 RepID=A0A560LST3_9BRAD|nr:sterol desaturase family protein [Bradyrhizobium macuxiense]TWB96290.1 sterol desaturase/sphingolipid hydroxylase (fatty acid hydroxylase superfamily) [Bradyrhizobium macuxiense]
MSSEISNAVFCAAVLLGIVYGSRILEKTWPIAPVSSDEFRADWLAVIVSVGLEHLFAPLAAISAGAIASYAGFGWIKLPTEGYWWYVSFAIVVVALDLYKYTFHRLQHAIPFLWAMHSFHHSANGITFITGGRHFWLERVLSDAFLPIMAILFRIPPDMAIAAAFIFFVPDACAHLNVRIPLGRFVTWINNPQWHRIHHSVQIEHRDKNFAAFFPLLDILFGTAWVPKPDEYPATGLVPPERADIINSIIWPIRHLRRGESKNELG